MPKSPPIASNTLDEAVLRRAETLDALDSIFPFERRDRLAQLLTDKDAETLKRLIEGGAPENSIRALAADLGYLQAWSLATTGGTLPWPAPEALVQVFMSQHLTSGASASTEGDGGMPQPVEQEMRRQAILKGALPHAPSTVRRRLASWATLTRARDLSGPFAGASIKQAFKRAEHASRRSPTRMSATDVTDDILARLLSTCKRDGLVGCRDRAILLLLAASGGRRRAEVANLRFDDVSIDGRTDSPGKRRRAVHLTVEIGRPGSSEQLSLPGDTAKALLTWIAEAWISGGPVFRKIDQWGNVSRRTLTPQSVNLIVKARAKKAGLDPTLVSAQGLRSASSARTRDKAAAD